MPRLDAQALRRARVGAQWLHRPKATATDVVAHLLAVQAQDISSFPRAITARSSTATVDDVAAARDERSIVRAWGPRGTLHLMAARDHAWMTELFAPLWRAQSLRRLRQEGVPQSEDVLIRVVSEALAGQGPLTKAALGERLASLSVPAAGQGIVHAVALGASHGLVVLGPDRGTKPTYVFAADWLPAPAALTREAALGELAGRYLASRGPAGPEDLAAWSGLGLNDARAAFARVSVVEVEADGRPLWRLARGASRAATVERALLPAYDEYLLSWRDRDLILGPAHASKVYPGGGILRPVIVTDGVITGTWAPATGALTPFPEAAPP